MNINKQKGFTLIELLISILLIVIMTGVVLVIINPAQVRGRARDAQRISEIMTVKTALEQYYLKKRAYPASVSGNTAGAFIYINGSSDALSSALINANVLAVVPKDPIGTTTTMDPCSGTTDYRYNYWAPARSAEPTNSDKFMLTAIMEGATSNDGNECGRLVSWGSVCQSSGSGCPGNGLSGNFPNFVTCNYCFGVEGK